jgi:hypothetical protein
MAITGIISAIIVDAIGVAIASGTYGRRRGITR